MSAPAEPKKTHSIDYLELAATDMERSKAFYAAAFGFQFNDYGPGYAGFVDGRRSGEAGGLRKEEVVHPAGPTAPLPILWSDALEATRDAVVAAGGKLTKDIFSFPGGRRFQFTDPAGNELGVWSGP
jgi:predicted enzyme related to lactoylglutathione lyase